ncbi:hypothetical protein XfCFBP8078_03365 [Xylella fastidiosa subsp. multiplex]|nr:hypothetical protein XfCFBP8078_03365 [Xylella fastidiosa subsp. multiplex]
MGCWAVGLLGCWAVGLLGCWVVGLLGCCGGRSRRNLLQIGVDAATVQFAADAEGAARGADIFY